MSAAKNIPVPQPFRLPRFKDGVSVRVLQTHPYELLNCTIAVSRLSPAGERTGPFFMNGQEFKTWIDNRCKDGLQVDGAKRAYKLLLCDRANLRRGDDKGLKGKRRAVFEKRCG